MTIKAIFLTIAGWFIVPFLAWRTPATATHYRWLDGIFGNGTPDTLAELIALAKKSSVPIKG